MENNPNGMQPIIDAAAAQAAAQEPQPQQDDTALRLRAQELITQARTILEVAKVDLFAVYNTDVDVRTKILTGQMDFIELYRQMRPAIQPPAPVRSANGGVGSVSIGGMNDVQFEKLNQMLSRGGKVDMRY